jgi:hypothetical protein
MMTIRRICLAMAILLLLAPGAVGQTCTPKAALTEYLTFHHPNEDVLVLDLDHRRRMGWWKGWRWNGHGLTPLGEPDFELNSADQPHLMVPHRQPEDVLVVVTDSNPLLYTTNPVKAEKVDREDLAEIQQLAGLLGNLATSTVQVAGARDALLGASPEGEITVAFEVERDWPPIFLPPDDFEPELPREEVPAEVLASLARIDGALVAPRQEVEVAGRELARAAGALEREVGSFNDRVARAETYLREVELSRARAVFADWPAFDAGNAAFASLRAARNDLQRSEIPCGAQLQALHDALQIKMRGLSTDPVTQRERREKLRKAIDQLAAPSPCPVDRDLKRVSDWLDDNPPGTEPADAAVLASLQGIDSVLRATLALAAARGELLKKADELLGKQATLGKDAQRFAIVADRQSRYLGGRPSLCALNHGVLLVPRAESLEVDTPWSQLAKETFKVGFDSVSAGTVIATRPAELEAAYQLERRPSWFDFDVDLGLVHTDVASPEFEAVAAATEVPEGEEPPKVIAQTGEESRSGTIAAFATLLPWRARSFRIGPQLGVALDTDDPALFLGLSIGNRYVKVNGGYTWQQIDELAPGQSLGVTEVASTDDIRTRRTYDGNWYVGLSLSIDNLNFFGGGDD